MNRYKDIGQMYSSKGTAHKRNPIYPTLPLHEEDIYIVTSIGDRYDTLASQFYKDSSLWWVIASANNFEKASLIVQPGVQLRIPGNKTEAVRLYNEVNTIR